MVTDQTIRIGAGEVMLCHELVGDPAGPVMVLVNGLGGQLIDWDDSLLGALRTAGFATLRFDNRDAGRSSGADERFRFDLQAVGRRDHSAVAYRLDDLADDVVGLLDALGIDRAHVLGVSMGGMIAQLVALRHGHRVASLCSIMSTTGARDVGQPSERAVQVLLRPAAHDRAGRIEQEVETQATIGSPGFPADPARVRRRAGARYDRAFRPAGTGRQLMAILMADDRTERLRGLSVPTLVVHGADDALVHPSGGQATADAVPGATLLTVPGMGHEIPLALVPTVVDAVVANAARGDSRIAAPAPMSGRVR